jgi:hypothetical protein
LLRDHVTLCVEHAIASGDKEDQRLKIKELTSLRHGYERRITLIRLGAIAEPALCVTDPRKAINL